MKTFAWLCFVCGILYSGSNLRDELRGETTYYSPGLRSSVSWMPRHADKESDPEAFRGVMPYQWFGSIALVGIGCYTLGVLRDCGVG